MPKESKIYKVIKKKCPRTKVYRIENAIDVGMPDMHYINENTFGWIEAKQITLPKKESTLIKIPFRPAQLEWIRQYRMKGDYLNVRMLLAVIDDYDVIRFALNRDIRESYTREEFNSLRSLDDLKSLGILI